MPEPFDMSNAVCHARGGIFKGTLFYRPTVQLAGSLRLSQYHQVLKSLTHLC